MLKLVEEGKLKLNDTLGKYMPHLRREIKDKITVHHLLSHQSGLPEFYEGRGADFDLMSFIRSKT
jgi:CubicO group peptidase (beta-lactamase class C family)